MDKVDIMQEQMNKCKSKRWKFLEMSKKEVLEIKNTSVTEMKSVFWWIH